MVIAGIAGLFLGILAVFIRTQLTVSFEIAQTRRIAEDIIESAKNKEALAKEQARSTVEEYEFSIKNKLNKEIDPVIEANQSLQSNIDKMNYKNKIQIQNIKNKIQTSRSQLNDIQNQVKQKIKKDMDLSQREKFFYRKYAEKLTRQFSFDLEKMKKEIRSRLIKSAESRGMNQAQKNLEEFEKDLEKNTLRVLDQVISRFQRISCEERGIRPVYFKSNSLFRKMISHGRSYINLIEVECGVDIVVEEKESSFNVQGLDPVRREWTRLLLEGLAKKRRIDKGIILSAVSQSKKDLFRKIKQDGNRICNALKLKNVPFEVRNMLGALRYRYSFAQNQHFHCEEVGWLCGLLMSEWGDSVNTGRQAGLFHDIGKAMDHAQSGGHAVIGADFIQKHGIDPKIVYAVRAHHNDVSPTDYLDFLVITADAISGSRPGARRSTEDSYNQKISSMEKIGKSFKEVQDIYVMNAGREIRVIVNAEQVNDRRALEVSKKVAQRIEEECSYPGWVKVTVVRTTQTHQMTKTA